MNPAPKDGTSAADAEDVVRLARETFLADERVDMQALAAQLGIGRALSLDREPRGAP